MAKLTEFLEKEDVQKVFFLVLPVFA